MALPLPGLRKDELDGQNPKHKSATPCIVPGQCLIRPGKTASCFSSSEFEGEFHTGVLMLTRNLWGRGPGPNDQTSIWYWAKLSGVTGEAESLPEAAAVTSRTHWTESRGLRLAWSSELRITQGAEGLGGKKTGPYITRNPWWHRLIWALCMIVCSMSASISRQ